MSEKKKPIPKTAFNAAQTVGASLLLAGTLGPAFAAAFNKSEYKRGYRDGRKAGYAKGYSAGRKKGAWD